MRHPGIEPGALRWQRSILPLNQWRTRMNSKELPVTLTEYKLNADSKMVRRPGIEPGPPAWKAGILTTELSTPWVIIQHSRFPCGPPS